MLDVQELRQGLCETLKRQVESGAFPIPFGFALNTRSPRTFAPNEGVTTVYGTDICDLDALAYVVREIALKGQAVAAGISLVSRRDLLPAYELFEVKTESVAVLYIDSVADSYEVWVAPIDSNLVGSFTCISSANAELPHVLPLALYGPCIGEA